jgi:nitroreductase|tara:strand:- start:4889 stop:5461 length:573 start_codon:yes stop_codon:yes gene_type:complete
LVLNAIKARRTTRDFTEDPVSNSALELMIEAATWAPNHRNTEPWRFIVLSKDGEMRKKVAKIVHDWTYENIKNPNPERRKSSAREAQQEILDAPAFMYVYSVEGRDYEMTRENYSATSCAVQNLMLTAESIGIGVGWSTGKPCLAPIDTAIGAEPDWDIVGALYIGYPTDSDENKSPRKRTPTNNITIWS